MKAKTIIAIAVPLLLLATCVGMADDSSEKKTTTDANGKNIVEDNTPKSDWSYSQDTDEMTDKTIYYAWVTSENSVDFDFPYSGGSTLNLTLRDSPQYGKDIYIKISSGQFNTKFDGTRIKMRFDDEQPISVTCNEASDNSLDILFVSSGNIKKVANKLKTAKKLKISAEFFNEATRTFTFDVADLEWPHF